MEICAKYGGAPGARIWLRYPRVFLLLTGQSGGPVGEVVSPIEQNREALAGLCRRYGVNRLYVFGSAVREELTASSDLDFLVEMSDRSPTGEYADRYLGLADDLERLFGRRVDLLTDQAMRNPYLRREVEDTRVLVYG